MNWQIRQMLPSDIAAVAAIQDQCYGSELFEPASLLTQRLAVAPDSCWVVQSATRRQILSYAFSYRAVRGTVSVLASPFAPCADADVVYLHDMAVAPQARGLGLAGALLQQIVHFAQQQQLDCLALVAVQDAAPYWARHGFVSETVLSAQAMAALDSYTGQQACYMTRLLR